MAATPQKSVLWAYGLKFANPGGRDGAKKVPPEGPAALCYEAWKLICVEVDALELYGYEALLSLLEVLADGELAVLDELLLHEAGFLEELVETALGDVFDHLGGQVGCLLGRYGGDDLACLGGLLLGDPALGGVALDVSLAVDVGGVDAGLLESGLYGLLDLLFLGLVDGHVVLALLDGGGYGVAADGYGVHRRYLHGHVAAYLVVDALRG